MSDGKILCAIDFGTTYSGVAYAYVEDGAKVRTSVHHKPSG
jgi:hypothetical protein